MLSLEEFAREAAGNWRKFESFVWTDQPDDAENWTIFHTQSAQSGLLEQSNADAIERRLQPYIETGDVVPQHFRHWAVGWIDALAVRVYDDEGNITPAFRELYGIVSELSDYPILDEFDYSRREYEASIENIEEATPYGMVREDAPEYWPEMVMSWLWDNEPSEAESVDDRGAWPSEEAIERALRALGLLNPEWEE